MLRIELQYSGIQDSRFKVPGKSFPGILNPGPRVLNFNPKPEGFSEMISKFLTGLAL